MDELLMTTRQAIVPLVILFLAVDAVVIGVVLAFRSRRRPPPPGSSTIDGPVMD